MIPIAKEINRAIDILIDKINTFMSNMVSKNANVITINASSQMNGGFDLIIKDEDDTLGNLIQSHLCMMYADYNLPKEARKLRFIGYKKPHPLENHIIISIQGNSDKIDDIIEMTENVIIKNV